jgi:hypothetical protein
MLAPMRTDEIRTLVELTRKVDNGELQMALNSDDLYVKLLQNHSL